MPTTEGAAEMMGARPNYEVMIPASDGAADAMGFIPGGSLEDQIAFADVQPTTTVPSVVGASPDLNLDLARPGGTGLGVALEKPVNVAIQKPAVVAPAKRPMPAFPTLGFNRRRIR